MALIKVAPTLSATDAIFKIVVLNDVLYGIAGNYNNPSPPQYGALYAWNGVDAWVPQGTPYDENIIDIIAYQGSIWGVVANRWENSDYKSELVHFSDGAWHLDFVTSGMFQLASLYVYNNELYTINGNRYLASTDSCFYKWNTSTSALDLLHYSTDNSYRQLIEFNNDLYALCDRDPGDLHRWNGSDFSIAVSGQTYAFTAGLCVHNGLLYKIADRDLYVVSGSSWVRVVGSPGNIWDYDGNQKFPTNDYWLYEPISHNGEILANLYSYELNNPNAMVVGWTSGENYLWPDSHQIESCSNLWTNVILSGNFYCAGRSNGSLYKRIQPTSANFSATTSALANQQVNFTDLSTGILSAWFWGLGRALPQPSDGWSSNYQQYWSKNQNATYTYSTAGIKNVELRVNNGEGVISKNVNIYPRTPSPLSAVGNINKINLTWNGLNDGASYYKIFRGLSSDNETLLTTTNTEYYEDNNVVVGTTYYYKVLGTDASQTLSSNFTNEVSAIALALPTLFVDLSSNISGNGLSSTPFTYSQFVNDFSINNSGAIYKIKGKKFITIGDATNIINNYQNINITFTPWDITQFGPWIIELDNNIEIHLYSSPKLNIYHFSCGNAIGASGCYVELWGSNILNIKTSHFNLDDFYIGYQNSPVVINFLGCTIKSTNNLIFDNNQTYNFINCALDTPGIGPA